MIKKSIRKNIDHIYCNNLELLEDIYSMLNLDIYMNSNKKTFDKNNLNALLTEYIQFLDEYFLYLNCEFFNQIFSFRTTHYRLVASKYFHEHLSRVHKKYATQANYTKETLVRHAVNKINNYSQFVYGDVH